ncbi:unnamed protein product [Taenia asiatica]|uniref:WD_REPEATS_REGION domain-containing protein n=1 Tax=Taenia asiatica TaxID=60517 RepID=A0A0R3WD52_TAEAS|nr:unnamed protein product [Taenia asiatica]
MQTYSANEHRALFICVLADYAMIEFGRCLVILGLITLVHAAYSAIQHRTYLKLTGAHFDFLPPDIFWQTIVGLLITIAGVVRVAVLGIRLGTDRHSTPSATAHPSLPNFARQSSAQMVVLTCLSGPDTVSCLSFSNKLLARGFENGSIHLSPPDNCASVIVLSPSSELCTAVAFVGDDSDVFYSSHDGNIVVWDLRNYATPVNVWKVSIDEINCIDVNAQDECLATADDVGMVSLVSSSNGKITRALKNHDNICSAAKFRPTCQNQLISCGLDCRLVVCDWKAGGNKRKVIEMASLVDPRRYANLLNAYLNEGGASRRRKVNKKSNEDAAPVRIASSLTSEEAEQMVATRALGPGLLFNPPMIHSLGFVDSGNYVTVGLGNGTVEVFQGCKNLQHVETLLGHRRSVAALLPVGNSHLLSGGDDCCLFLWEVSRGGTDQRFVHTEKVSALAGREFARIYVADNTSDVKVGLLAGKRSQMNVLIVHEAGFLAGDGPYTCVIELQSMCYVLPARTPR